MAIFLKFHCKAVLSQLASEARFNGTDWFNHMYSYFHLHSNIQIYILQYNHDGIHFYTNLFPFEEKGEQ